MLRQEADVEKPDKLDMKRCTAIHVILSPKKNYTVCWANWLHTFNENERNDFR